MPEPNDNVSGSNDTGAKTSENTSGKATNYVESLPPGSLIGADWSRKPALELRESHINAVRALLKKFKNRDMPARREEILRVWEAELFWRGYQHLLPSRMGFGWEFAGPGSGYGPGEPGFRSEFSTNFYTTYGLSVVGALTRQIPKVLFEAVSPKDDADITAASAANKLVSVINRNNNILSLMSDMAQNLWTGGRVSFYTRYVKDGQRFGWGKQDESENIEEASAESAGVPLPGEKPEKTEPGSGDPRGMVVTTPHGPLEVKYPIKCNSQSEAGWLIWSREVDLSVAKGMYPKKADKIVVSRGGPAGDDVDRLARINVALGVNDNFLTSDTEAFDVTVENSWLRDCSLLEIEDEQVRDELLKMSRGRGLRFTFCGQEFIECKQESMDNHWTLCFALPGKGIHRLGLGTNYIPMQKNVNTLLELRQDYLIRGIPLKFMDSDMFDVENLSKQAVVPGGIKPFTADPMRPTEDFVFVEPTIQYPNGLEEAIEDSGRGQSAQIITGVFPALSGDDAGQVSETMGGLKLQRDAALGRIGIPWRYIKEAIASVTLQAVQCLAENHDEDIVASGSKSGSDPIIVELQDLKGKYNCTPSTDENFPESWSEIQNRVGELMLESQANPELLDVVNHPNNYPFLKKATGLTELYIPKQESAEKQLGEIEDMKKSGPMPNPALDVLKKQIASAPAPTDGGPEDVAIQQKLAQLKQRLASMPETVSSVEVDEKVDDHETEALVTLAFLRSPSGRALKAGTSEDGPDGEPSEQSQYENIRLHYLTHADFAQKAAAAKQQQPQRAVSKSIAAGDLIKAGMSKELAQLLGEANIKSDGTPPAAALPAAA